MEVNKEDYNNCNSTQPNYFSNKGNSVFSLDDAGTFYFISGASGHCERGQRMVVRVMSPQESYNPTASPAPRSTSGVFKLVFITISVSFLLVLSNFFY